MRHEYFDEFGNPSQGRNARPWEDRFEKHIQIPRQKAGVPTFDVEEKAAVMDMLRSMLSFEPEKRYNAREILHCEWMKRWALADFERFHGENNTATKDLPDAVQSIRSHVYGYEGGMA